MCCGCFFFFVSNRNKESCNLLVEEGITKIAKLITPLFKGFKLFWVLKHFLEVLVNRPSVHSELAEGGSVAVGLGVGDR